MAELHTVYSGEKFRVAPAAQVSQQSQRLNVEAEYTARGAQQVYENMSEFEREAVDRAEYALDMQRKRYITEAKGEIDAACARGMSMPDGHPESFYDANGQFREDYYAAFITRAQSKFDNLHLGYVMPESQEKALGASQVLQASIKADLDVKMAQNLAPRARAATRKLAEFQLEQGDYVGARATYMGAPDYAMSDLDRQMALTTVDQHSLMNTARTAVDFGDAEAFLALITDEEALAKLTPDQRHKLLGLQDEIPETTPFEDEIVPDADFDRAGSPAKPTGKTAHLGLPMSVPDELVRLYDSWNLYNDPNAKNNEEMQRQARSALASWAGAYVTPDMSEQDSAHFANVAGMFGVSKSDAEDIIEAQQRALRPTKQFQPDAIMKHAKQTYFTPVALRKKLDTYGKAIANAVASGASDEEIKGMRSAKKMLEDSQKDLLDTVEARVRTTFAAWYAQQKPETLTDADLNVAFMNAIDMELEKAYGEFSYELDLANDYSSGAEYLQAKRERDTLTEARSAAEARRKELDERVAATDDRRRRAMQDAASVAELQASREATPRQRGSGYAMTRLDMAASKTLPDTFTTSYIAVPKGDQLAGQFITIKKKGRTHRYECREADVAAPTLSVKAQSSLGLIGSKQTFSLAYNQSGAAALVNTSVPPSDFDMYRTILREEARRGKDGKLKVHKLPAADGGGAYEVAGINVKYHPEEARKLKAMIESGAPDEAVEQEVMSYYKSYTQFGHDMISPYTKSKGLELFIRDCSLNHSPKGVRWILRNAVGVGSDKEIGNGIANFIAVHGEMGMLKALANARKNYYLKVASDSPSKKIFINGWLNNRLPDIYRASYAALRQRSNP